MIGIYKITSPKGYIYVGSSNRIEYRKYQYIKQNCKGQVKLYNSLKKYGWEKHKFEILEECELKDLFPLERAWGLFYNSIGKKGLNLSLPGYGEIKGIVSEETKDKISKVHKGRKHSEKSKYRISEALRGRIHSEETRQKISKGNTGKIRTDIQKIKYSTAKKSKTGYKQTEQHKNNIRLSITGKLLSDETKLKISIAKKGKSFSNEHRENLSLASKGKKNKKVLDTVTGIIYESKKEAAAFNTKYKESTLSLMLNGHRTNNTNLIYI